MTEAATRVPLAGDFVVSRSAGSKIRRLHRVGWCWREPGIDYRVETVLEGEPQGTEYNRLCLDCWRDRRGRDGSVLEEEATERKAPRAKRCPRGGPAVPRATKRSPRSRTELSELGMCGGVK